MLLDVLDFDVLLKFILLRLLRLFVDVVVVLDGVVVVDEDCVDFVSM